MLEEAPYFTNDQREEAIEYIKKFRDFTIVEHKVSEELIKALTLIKNSNIKNDSIFKNKLNQLYKSIIAKGEVVNKSAIDMKKFISSVYQNIAVTKSINPINNITNKIKKDKYMDIRFSFYREIIKLLDDTLNYILLSSYSSTDRIDSLSIIHL